MLIRLLPEQIASNWEFIKSQIVDNGPLENAQGVDRHINILESLLIGEMHCWVEAIDKDGKFLLRALLVTQILENGCAGVRNLLIYSFVGMLEAFTLKAWQRAFLTLAQFARKENCQNIIAYTSNQNMIRLAERFHGDVSQRVAIFPLN